MDFLPGEPSRVRVRLLPWRPGWRTARDGEVPDVSDVFDFLDEPVSAVIGLVLAVLVLTRPAPLKAKRGHQVVMLATRSSGSGP